MYFLNDRQNCNYNCEKNCKKKIIPDESCFETKFQILPDSKMEKKHDEKQNDINGGFLNFHCRYNIGFKLF